MRPPTGRNRPYWRPLLLVAATAALALVAPAPASGSATSATKVGAWSIDWPWFDRAVGPVDVYRGYDSGFSFSLWQDTATYQAHPNGAQFDYSFKLPPADVAAGLYDAKLKTFIASTPKNISLTNYHEPEEEVAAGLFTFAQFRRAIVHLNALVDARNAFDGGTRRVPVILMSDTFIGFKSRNPENYWPTAAKGDGGTADLISVDAYALPHATNTTGVPPGYTDGVNWRSPQALLGPVLNFAVAHSTRWAVSELGYLEDVNNPTRKAQALQDAVSYARANRALWISVWDCKGRRADWQIRYNNPPVPSTSSASNAVLAWKAAVSAP
jgi:hypothetical protein